MSKDSAQVVICGAGIAGVCAAYHLVVRHGIRDVVLVDERPPLSLTSDKSTECYRNWWPGPGDAMVRLTNRSIDLLEELARESGNCFNLNRRGYLFATADPARIEDFRAAALEAESLGAGPLREQRGKPDDPPYIPAPFEGFENLPIGADLITDQALIAQHFPYISDKTVAVMHPRRCGWFSAQLFGTYLLERARAKGLRMVQARMHDVEVSKGRVQRVFLQGDGVPASVSTRKLVIAAGPMLKEVGDMIGVELPVFSEFHNKIAFNDHLGTIGRSAPLVIWSDPVLLPWSDEERALLAEDEETRYMLEEFVSGVHARPEGPQDSPMALILWTYHTDPVEPIFPPPYVDPHYAEILMRGMSVMIPRFAEYIGRAPRPAVDGGYYTKTQENRLLVGPLPVEGAYIIGALSGYGMMASPAAGELLAAHLTGTDLPDYASWFLLERYDDPEYQKLLEDWGSSGQL
jgi:glycine/D-amino acid oxidase-like deaminating enzyme